MAVNPLFIPSILNQVLSFLEVSDLKSSRLVCRAWTEEGTKILTVKTKFYINTGQEYNEFQEFLLHYRDPSCVSKLGSIKSFNFKFTLLGSRNEFMEENQNTWFIQLLRDVGPKIKCLDLENDCTPWLMKTLQKILQNYVPKLEKLCLNTKPTRDLGYYCMDWPIAQNITHLSLYYDEEFQQELESTALSVPLTIVQLFKAMPNLKYFSCNNVKGGEEVIECLLKTEYIHTFNPKFSEFGFELKLSPHEVTGFHQVLKYPLESLNLSLRPPSLRYPGLYSYLSSLGTTLHTLRLNFGSIPQNTESFPCGRDLVNLKYLRFENFNGPLNFIHHMSKLEKLVLVNANLSVAFIDSWHGGIDFETPHGLKSLDLFYGRSSAGRVCFPDIFRKMVKLFPNLERFRMDYLSDSSLKILVQGFTKLRELILENCICSDEGFTGFKANRHIIRDANQLNLDSSDRTLERELPCISDFKHLRRLHLNSPMMTDLSLIYGISMCKELTELHLRSSSITAKGLKSVVENVCLNTLELKGCYRITLADVNELQKFVPNVTMILD